MTPDFELDKVRLFNCDCMKFMAEIPDSHYELAIVDPPYGIGFDGNSTVKGKAGKASTFSDIQHHKQKQWDSNIPDKSYFDELRRISVNQIICGGNYFANMLPNSRGWIYWDKKITNANNTNFSDGELLWTSFSKRLIKFTYDWIGFGYLNNPQREKKIHPTQKPIQLYKWLLTNYAKPNDKIFDSHGGSFSSACAALDMGFEFDGCELDKDYFDSAVNRIRNHSQLYIDLS